MNDEMMFKLSTKRFKTEYITNPSGYRNNLLRQLPGVNTHPLTLSFLDKNVSEEKMKEFTELQTKVMKEVLGKTRSTESRLGEHVLLLCSDAFFELSGEEVESVIRKVLRDSIKL